MTRTLLIMAAALLSLTGTAQAQTPMTGPFKAVYVPIGFDGNDRVQITVESSFNDSCYRVDDPEVKIDTATNTIQIQARAFKIDGYCLVLPGVFAQTISLGHLSAGTYKITSWDKSSVYATLDIEPAKVATVDDYLYAPVSQAYVTSAGGVNKLILSGTLPSSCMTLKDVMVKNQEHVVVVQPVLDAGASSCVGSPTPFEKTIVLAPEVKGHYLLHVRSMAGTALNQMVDL